jgi:hypothetical protein
MSDIGLETLLMSIYLNKSQATKVNFNFFAHFKIIGTVVAIQLVIEREHDFRVAAWTRQVEVLRVCVFLQVRQTAIDRQF